MSTAPSEIHGIIAAAGGSRRMGQPKLNLTLAKPGAPPASLLEHHVAGLLGFCSRVTVVVGPVDPLRPLPEACVLVQNRDWAHTQQADSLALALPGIPPRARVLFTPVDVPPAPPAVLEALLVGDRPRVAGFRGRPGHPVCLTAEDLRTALAEGHLGRGLEELGAEVIESHWPGCLINLNTPEAWSDWTGSNNSQ